jgi:hypothetical protein
MKREDANRLAQLAVEARVERSLVWERATTCLQGHSVIEDWGADRCGMCETMWWNADDHDDDMKAQWLDDPTFHPEWAIPWVPRAFNTAHITTVVEAWIATRPPQEQPEWRYVLQVSMKETQAFIYRAVEHAPAWKSFSYEARDPHNKWEALAYAFLSLLEGESGK